MGCRTLNNRAGGGGGAGSEGENGEAMRRKRTAHQGEIEMMEGSQLRRGDRRMEPPFPGQGRAQAGEMELKKKKKGRKNVSSCRR